MLMKSSKKHGFVRGVVDGSEKSVIRMANSMDVRIIRH